MAPDRASSPAGVSGCRSSRRRTRRSTARPALWQNGVTGAGVGIAVIDSGVTPRADFGSRLVQVQLPTQDGTQLNDNVGHGSVVAGVAAGQSADGQLHRHRAGRDACTRSTSRGPTASTRAT